MNGVSKLDFNAVDLVGLYLAIQCIELTILCQSTFDTNYKYAL